ncbi:MAG: tetratricopeptide repeat protein [Myxococcales bacterium]|nr:tetratricopeptide repeat protein [Myxococcales bacterium]
MNDAAQQVRARAAYVWEAVGVVACLVIPLVLLIVLRDPTRVQLLILRLVSALGVSSLAAFAVRGFLGDSRWGQLGLRALVFALSFFALDLWVIPALQHRATGGVKENQGLGGGLEVVDAALDARDLDRAERELTARCDDEADAGTRGLCAYHRARLALYRGELARARGELEVARASEALEPIRGRVHELAADVALAEVAKAPGTFAARKDEIYGALRDAIASYEQDGETQGRANAYLRLANAQIQHGELDAGEDSLRAAEQLYGQNKSPKGLAAVARARGDLLAQRESPDDAVAAYLAAEQQYLAIGDSQGVASVKQAQANMAAGSGDRDAARELLQEAGRLLDEDTPTQRVIQQRIEQQIEQLSQPLPTLLKPSLGASWGCDSTDASRGDRTGARARWRDGNERYKAGAREQAIASYREAMTLDPSYAPAYYSLGRVAMDVAAWDRAEQCLNAAIKRDPEYLAAYNNLAIVYATQDKVPMAREQLEQLEKIADGEDPQGLYTRAVVEAQTGKHDDARSYAKRAAKSAKAAPRVEQRAVEQQALQLIQTVDGNPPRLERPPTRERPSLPAPTRPTPAPTRPMPTPTPTRPMPTPTRPQ